MTAIPPNAHAAAWEEVIGTGSFGGYGALESEWNYRYPWGSDHNGTARMYASATTPVRSMNNTDADIHYYLDGKWIAQHTGKNFVASRCG